MIHTSSLSFSLSLSLSAHLYAIFSLCIYKFTFIVNKIVILMIVSTNLNCITFGQHAYQFKVYFQCSCLALPFIINLILKKKQKKTKRMKKKNCLCNNNKSLIHFIHLLTLLCSLCHFLNQLNKIDESQVAERKLSERWTRLT